MTLLYYLSLVIFLNNKISLNFANKIYSFENVSVTNVFLFKHLSAIKQRFQSKPFLIILMISHILMLLSDIVGIW